MFTEITLSNLCHLHRLVQIRVCLRLCIGFVCNQGKIIFVFGAYTISVM